MLLFLSPNPMYRTAWQRDLHFSVTDANDKQQENTWWWERRQGNYFYSITNLWQLRLRQSYLWSEVRSSLQPIYVTCYWNLIYLLVCRTPVWVCSILLHQHLQFAPSISKLILLGSHKELVGVEPTFLPLGATNLIDQHLVLKAGN